MERLVSQFSDRTLPLSEWTHEAHLTVALWYLYQYTEAAAVCYLRSGIITYNQSLGGENTPQRGYHETLTLFWVKIIHHFIRKNPGLDLPALRQALLASPIASRDLPEQYYSKELLYSTHARAFWTEPDIKALP